MQSDHLHSKILLLSLSLLIHFSNPKIHIWEPKSLKAIYANHDIPYSVMNFGVIPYGHSVYGTVFKANPFDACTELSPLKWDKNYGTLIMLVERGGCNFSEKVYNAQKIGAGLVLIGDNNNEDVHKIFPVERTKEMLDKVHIPSVLISKADSDNFQLAMENSSQGKSGNGSVELAFHFDLVKVNHDAKVRIILQVDDFRSYDVISEFLDQYTAFKGHLQLQIHFKIFFNDGGFFSDDDCRKVGTDTYCVGKSFGDDKRGLGLVEETVRQLCLKDYDNSLFVSYARQVRQQCFGENRQVVDEFRQCTGRVYQALITEKVRDKLSACLTLESPENTLALKKNHDEIKYFLINYAPLIFINGFYYKGNFDDLGHLWETICNSYESPPKPCYSLENFVRVDDMNSTSLVKFIIITLGCCIFMILIAVILFYIVYKKKIRKRFNFELNDKINEALANYYSDKDVEINEKEQSSTETRTPGNEEPGSPQPSAENN